MGTLTYGALGTVVTFDDRVLAHLRAVITAKLRRDEKFTLSWENAETGATETLWCHPAIALQFSVTFAGPLNRAWVEALSTSANSASGLRLLPEPATPKP